MPASPEEFLAAADALVKRLGQDRVMSEKELEPVRKKLEREIKGDMRDGLARMQTVKIGRSRVLIPNSQNIEQAGIVGRRTQQRMSAFRLRFLDVDAAERAIRNGTLSEDPTQFIRHSQRLHRHAREYLQRLGELEPDLQEEIDATLIAMADNRLDLIKLETKSFTRSQENLIRMVNGRMTRVKAGEQIDRYQLNRQLWNQSLIEHPTASTRALLADAAERMGQRVSTKVSEVPKRSFVTVGVPESVAEKMTPASRVASRVSRLFSVADLDARTAAAVTAAGAAQSVSTWRGLGIGHGTQEWYVPTPPETVTPELEALMRERRSAILAKLREQAKDKNDG